MANLGELLNARKEFLMEEDRKRAEAAAIENGRVRGLKRTVAEAFENWISSRYHLDHGEINWLVEIANDAETAFYLSCIIHGKVIRLNPMFFWNGTIMPYLNGAEMWYIEVGSIGITKGFPNLLDAILYRA